MELDNSLISAKLRRWESYLNRYHMPAWDHIPDFGLYMEQVITLLKQYLDYLPPELLGEQSVTAATINNYVRMRIVPAPEKKRYYRRQIAYLLMVCTLKQTLSISMINAYLPPDIEEEQLHQRYDAFRDRLELVAKRFVAQVGSIMMHDGDDLIVTDADGLIIGAAISGALSRLLAEKLILLDGKNMETGGSTELYTD